MKLFIILGVLSFIFGSLAYTIGGIPLMAATLAGGWIGFIIGRLLAEIDKWS